MQPPGQAMISMKWYSAFARAHRFEQLARVAERVRHGDLQRNVAHLNSRLLDAFQTAHHLEIERGQRLAGHDFVGRAEGRFHHAAGGAEDDRGAGGLAERIVVLALRQGGDVEARPPASSAPSSRVVST